jgi:hypothetical protein
MSKVWRIIRTALAASLAALLLSSPAQASIPRHSPDSAAVALLATPDHTERVGEWLIRDPLGEAGGINLTAFCGNDPVNRIDPLGLADSVAEAIIEKLTPDELRLLQEANPGQFAKLRAEAQPLDPLYKSLLIDGRLGPAPLSSGEEWFLDMIQTPDHFARFALWWQLGKLPGAVAGRLCNAGRSGGFLCEVETSCATRSGGRTWTWGRGSIPESDAEVAYQAIRESRTDVSAISRYTGYKAHRIQNIKDYLFDNPEWAADSEIAAAWHRLRIGAGTETDRLLLQHETAEMWYRYNVNPNYTPAHARANRHWDWQDAVEGAIDEISGCKATRGGN